MHFFLLSIIPGVLGMALVKVGLKVNADASAFFSHNHQENLELHGLSLQLISHKSYGYLVELHIGSNKQKVHARLDTGLTDLMVVTPNVKCEEFEMQILNNEDLDAWLIPSSKCTDLGSYDPAQSCSIPCDLLRKSFDIGYFDYTSNAGKWAADDVTLGDIKVRQQLFGAVYYTTRGISVFGIGMGVNTHCREESCVTLPFSLINQGYISKAVYSLYLNPVPDQNGIILFGAVDHAKYHGPLTTFPLISLSFLYEELDLKILIVVLDGITIQGGAGGDVLVLSNQYAAYLELRLVHSQFPPQLFNKLVAVLDGTLDRHANMVQVDCLYMNGLTVAMKFGDTNIKVPLWEFIRDNGGGNCTMAIEPQTDDYKVINFGTDVLRHMYVIYDLEEQEVSLAQVKHSDATNIEIVSGSVAGAVKASNYHEKTALKAPQEDLASVTVTVTTSTGPLLLATSDLSLNSNVKCLTGSFASKIKDIRSRVWDLYTAVLKLSLVAVRSLFRFLC